MDEQQPGDRENLSSIISLDRKSGSNSRHSPSWRRSIIEVMELQKNELHDELLDGMSFEERRASLCRSSNNSRINSGDNALEADDSREFVKNSRRNISRIINHECLCEGSCADYHCSCYNTPQEICIQGLCCDNCIRLKIQMFRSSNVIGQNCKCEPRKCAKRVDQASKCLQPLCKCFEVRKPVHKKQVAKREWLNPHKSKSALKNSKGPKNNETRAKNKHARLCTKCWELTGVYRSCKNCSCQMHSHQESGKQEKDQEQYNRVKELVESDDIDQYFQIYNFENEEMPKSMEFDLPVMRKVSHI